MKQTMLILALACMSLLGYAQTAPLDNLSNQYKPIITANYGTQLSTEQLYKLAAAMVILDSSNLLSYDATNTLTPKSKRGVSKMADNDFVNGTTINYTTLLYLITKNQIPLTRYALPSRRATRTLQTTIDFTRSVADAQMRFKQQQHVFSPLVTIQPQDVVPGSHVVEDSTIGGTTYFKVYTWKGSSTYFQQVDPKYNLRYYKSNNSFPLFVTVAPEIARWYKENKAGIKSNEQLRQRLAQLLGMPPGTTNDTMVSLWVRYEDLFRPTYDSSIARVGYKQDLTRATTDTTYIRWLNNYFTNSYTNPLTLAIYPFTGTGYTYDSYPNNYSHIGLSEFITRGGTIQYVSSIYCTKDFFDQLDE